MRVKTKIWQPLARRYGRLANRYGPRGAALLVGLAAALVIGGSATYASLLLGGGGGGAVNLQSGLVGWWKMDGNAKDSTPYAANGTLTGTTTTTDRKGTTGQALSFNGTTDQVMVGNHSQLQITGSQTISMWLKPADFSARRNPYSKAYAGEGTITQETNGTLSYYYGTGGCNCGASYQGFSSGTGSGILPLNTWSLVTIVRNLSTMQLTWYINGTQVNQTAATYGAAVASTLPVAIGAGYVSNYSGSIDDVRVYNRALSGTEVTALYKEYNPAFNAASGENGLIAWYKLDGNIKDATPYAHNGTLLGSPPYVADREGTANSALGLSSSGQMIDNAGIDIGNNWTVSVWSPYPNNGLEQSTHWRTLTRGGAGDHQIIVQNGGFALGAYDNVGGTGFHACSPTFNVNTLTNGWHHFVITQTGGTTGTMTFYIDGVQKCTISGYGSTTDIRSVGNYFGGGQWWGTIDDFRVYNRALTSNEITNLYHSYNSQIGLYSGTGSGSGVNLANGLVGEWDFTGNAKDSTPYAHNGTVTNATLTTDRHGSSNGAYNFSGNGTIDVGGSTFFNFTGDLTLSAWVYPTTSTGWEGVASKWGTTWAWGLNSGNHTDAFWLSGTTQWVYANTPTPTNSWSHLTVVYNHTAQTVTFYLNGSPDGVRANTDSHGTTGNVTIGSWSGNYYFTGTIDNVRIYQRALSAAEVQALYSLY